MMKILMATDFSCEAKLAQRRAKLLSQLVPGKLRVVHVPESEDIPLHSAPCNKNALGTIEGDQIDTIRGDPCEIIAGLTHDADLLVLGEPRRRGKGELFTGTTGDRIIRRSAAPVLVARTEATRHYRRVLLAVDLSAESIEIMQASKILQLAATDCWVAYVYESAQANLMIQASTYSIQSVREHIDRQRRTFEDKLTAQMKEAGLKGRASAVLVESDPASTILAFADRIRADLIILGSRRRSNLAKFVLGSVAAQVLSHSKADVLIVPPASV